MARMEIVIALFVLALVVVVPALIIANSPERGFVSVEEESLTSDSVHLTDKSYRRYLDIINKDVVELVRQDE